MLSKNQIKLIKSLALKKNRIHHQLFTVEGTKGIFEFLNSDFECHSIYTTNPELFRDEDTIVISELELKKISQLKNPNQSIALFHIPETSEINVLGFKVALDDVKDPGNLGTIIRLCDWFGISDLICSKETVDCFNSKVVQASMGSLSRVRVHYLDLYQYLNLFSGNIYGTFLNGNSIYDETYSSDSILLMGNESNGISTRIEKLISNRITIPQFNQSKTTESLNVATATAICLGEIRRPI